MDVSGMAVIQALALPPLSLFLLYGAGWGLRFRWPLFGRIVSGGAIALLFVLCTNAGAWLLLRPLESLEPPLRSANGAEAIVVLTAGRLENSPEYGGRDIPNYVALARLRYAAKLQRETGLPLLVSGGYGKTDDRDESLATGAALVLQEDFATPVTWTEDRSANTAQNAAFSAAMHMRRSRMAFSHEGLEVIGAPTMFFSRNKLRWLDFLPGAEGLRRSRYAIYEWLGMAWYGLQYALAPIAGRDVH
jgi:uncharacterized SAM-binding protein YcdF (DUF218 family)